ncbi:glycosyltransferase family 2 protein [Rhodococcus ruber]|uniref:glycosyltransferase family 2 protein n=1 Tax=Rhodococcus ruber TaxID=1830 RepID=UPI0037844332
MPRLSVILPVRNGADYVRSAVASTLTALTRDSELVVLDDGSQDRTPEILDVFKDRRLRILRREHSEGLASGLNYLLDATDSEIVGRMDADDVCFPWRFRHQVREYDRGTHFVFSQILHLGPGRFNLRPTRLDALNSRILPLQLLIENPVAHPTALFSRSAVRNLGCYRRVLSEDYDLWLRAAVRGYSMKRTSVPVLLYRHHPMQVTHREDWKLNSRTEPELVEAHSQLVASAIGLVGDRLSGLRSSTPTRGDLDRSVELIRALVHVLQSQPADESQRRLKRKLGRLENQLLDLAVRGQLS